jgi:hypothetical protein
MIRRMDTRPGAGYAASWTTEGTSGEKTVTEAEWLACTDPVGMLDFLRGKIADVPISHYPKGYDRKVGLFGCFCCRRFWPLLRCESSQRAVEVAERLAEGLASDEERRRAYENANDGNTNLRIRRLAHEARANGSGDLADLLTEAGIAASGGVYWNPLHRLLSAQLASLVAIQAAASQGDERATHAAWLHDLFGPLPFRSISLVADWLVWHDGLLVSMARQMYDRRDFSDMPVLADALEEAGCQDQDILGHCRSRGEHVRGCWVVDLCLGKA